MTKKSGNRMLFRYFLFVSDITYIYISEKDVFGISWLNLCRLQTYFVV